MTDERPNRQAMYDQILSQPTLLLEVCDQAEPLVQQALDHVQASNWQAVYTAGCGDSFYAGLACELAFARFCRLPVKALSAMQFARYEVTNLPVRAGVFGISNSGAVSRSIEAVAMAKAAGATTVAVTGNAASAIAQEADVAVAVPILPMGRSPGIRSYTVQLATLLLCAIRLGELHRVLSSSEAATWRQRLRDVSNVMEATIQACDTPMQRLAQQLHDQENWVFVGSGPGYATALFCAAKLVESCGANAWAQDIEEWAHIQYFNRQERTPTCLLMPRGPSLARGQELLPHMQELGRYAFVVTSEAETFDTLSDDAIFPIAHPVPELFSPLVYGLAAELLAYYLADVWDTQFFTATRRGVMPGGDRLRGSGIVRQLEALEELSG